MEAFESKFSSERWVQANQVYNEMISDAKHVHLSATKWTSLGAFIRDLCALENPQFTSSVVDGSLCIMSKNRKKVADAPEKLSIGEIKFLEKKREEKFLAK